MIFKNIFLLILLMVFIITCDSIYSQSNDTGFISDKTILQTDSEGNILGGDEKDWSFSKKNYKDIHKFIMEFATPFYKGAILTMSGVLEPITAEVEDQKVILKWITAAEIDNKGFYVERTELILMIEMISGLR